MRFILLVAVAIFVGAANTSVLSEAAEPHSDSWPRFLGHTFDGVAKAGDFDWTAEPELVWSLEVGDGYGIGSVAGGKYFHFDAEKSGDYEMSERMRGIDLETGKTVWAKSDQIVYSDLLGYEDGPRSSATIVGDRLYCMGVTGRLACRNTDDGQEYWSVETNKKYGVVQNFFGVGSSPLILGDRLITMIGGSPIEDQEVAPMRLNRVSPNGSAVVAFDRMTGKEVWRCGDDLASYSSPRPIELDGKTFVLVFARDHLLLVDPEAGEVKWSYYHRAKINESVNAMVPVVVGNRVLISECYEMGSVLLEVSSTQVKEVWKDPPKRRREQALRAHWATPVVVDGFLYGCSGRNASDSDFRCIDFATGEVQWVDRRRTRSSVTRVGDHLLVFEEDGPLQVMKPNSKEMEIVAEWALEDGAGERPGLVYPCWAAPIVVGDKLLVRGTKHVLCLKLKSR